MRNTIEVKVKWPFGKVITVFNKMIAQIEEATGKVIAVFVIEPGRSIQSFQRVRKNSKGELIVDIDCFGIIRSVGSDISELDWVVGHLNTVEKLDQLLNPRHKKMTYRIVGDDVIYQPAPRVYKKKPSVYLAVQPQAS